MFNKKEEFVEVSSQLRSLATARDTCITLYMPTHRYGSATVSDASRFSTLVNSVGKDLAESGLKPAAIQRLLEPIEQLATPASFWQNRTDGLAVFAHDGHCEHVSLPNPVVEQVKLGSHFYLRQAIPFLTDDTRFFVLSLSKNSVQLYEGNQHSLFPISAYDGPASMEEALQFEDPERQLQVRTTGSDSVSFHGHGAGDELDKEALERFLRAVEKGVTSSLRQQTAPLVLAAVPYYLPIYSSFSGYQHVFGEAIEGTPVRQSDKELHLAAVQLLQSHFDSIRKKSLNGLRDLVGTGLITDELSDIAESARSGRVQNLLLSSSLPSDSEQEEDLVNHAIVETIAHAGIVGLDPDADTANKPARALLRF